MASPPPPHSQALEGGALRAAATALYRNHHDFVWRNARRLGCTDDWVEDAVHEVFLVVGRRLAEFEHRAHERTWLFAITLRVVQRMRRDRARDRDHVGRYQQERPAPTLDGAAESEAAQYLRYLLSQLPDAQRVVLILAELEGFTSVEIAATLGVPAGTVDSRLRSAKLALARGGA